MISAADNSSQPKLDYRNFMLKPPDANISTIFAADAASMLRVLDDDFVDLVITSPPYAEKRKKAYGGVPAERACAEDGRKIRADGSGRDSAVVQ